MGLRAKNFEDSKRKWSGATVLHPLRTEMVVERETHFWIPNGVLAFAYLAPLWLIIDTNGYTLKLFSILGHTLLLFIPPDACCLDGLLEHYWYLAIIVINVISLYQSYRETVLPIIPAHFQPIFSKLFYEFPITHKELGAVVLYSKFTGIGRGTTKASK